MLLVILESPYAANTVRTVDEHIAFARSCVRDCLFRNESVIASHLLYTQEGILRDDVSDERILGINAGLAWTGVANYSVFYTDCGWSSGMLGALHKAVVRHRPFKIRGLIKPAILPASLDEDVERIIASCVEK